METLFGANETHETNDFMQKIQKKHVLNRIYLCHVDLKLASGATTVNASEQTCQILPQLNYAENYSLHVCRHRLSDRTLKSNGCLHKCGIVTSYSDMIEQMIDVPILGWRKWWIMCWRIWSLLLFHCRMWRKLQPKPHVLE